MVTFPCLVRVYKIVNDIDDQVYVGSTAKTLSNRWMRHRNEYCKFLKGLQRGARRLFQHFQKHGIEHFQIVLIAEEDCQLKDEQRRLEQRYISELKPALNCIRAYQTYEECFDSHRERDRAYRSKDPERFSQLRVMRCSKIIAEKRYYCCICDYASRDQFNLDKHLLSKRHLQKASQLPPQPFTEIIFVDEQPPAVEIIFDN
jgi:hypothetical protein